MAIVKHKFWNEDFQMLMQAVLKEAFEPSTATEPEIEESIAMAAEPAEAFGKQGEFGF